MNDMIFKDSLSFSANHHEKTRAKHKNLIVVGTQNDREDEQTEPDNNFLKDVNYMSNRRVYHVRDIA